MKPFASMPFRHAFRYFSCLLLVPILLGTGCNKEEKSLEYPLRFKYQNLDFQASRFYVLTGTSFTEINPTGSYVLYDDILKDELDIVGWEFEIEQVELLNDSQLKAYFFDYLGISPTNAIVPYTRSGDQITFGFETPIVFPYTFALDADGNAAHYHLTSIQHAQNSTSGDTDYSSIDIALGSSDDVSVLIAQRRTQYGLQTGDTVAVNHSGYFYPRQ